MTKTKILIDTDPGVDDAMAIYMAALHPGIEIVGLTTVFGNVTAATGTRNALYLLERAGVDAPVAEGADKPIALPPFPPSANVHGEHGFGDLPHSQPKAAALEESAVEFLCRMAREHKGELIVCPVGPMTNIAQAIQHDPEFARNVRQFVFMGGALDVPGNITPFAEANTYHDPHALKMLIESGADVVMVGLDVTLQFLLTSREFDQLAELDPNLGGHLKDMGAFYLKFYHSLGLEGCGMHDPLAVLACAEPELLRTERVKVDVVLEGEEVGRTFRSETGHEIAVALGVNSEAAMARFMGLFDRHAKS